MSAGYRSLVGFWIGGLSQPFVNPATFVAGSILIYPAINGAPLDDVYPALKGKTYVEAALSDAEIEEYTALEGEIEIDSAVEGKPRSNRSN